MYVRKYDEAENYATIEKSKFKSNAKKAMDLEHCLLTIALEFALPKLFDCVGRHVYVLELKDKVAYKFYEQSFDEIKS